MTVTNNRGQNKNTFNILVSKIDMLLAIDVITNPTCTFKPMKNLTISKLNSYSIAQKLNEIELYIQHYNVVLMLTETKLDTHITIYVYTQIQLL